MILFQVAHGWAFHEKISMGLCILTCNFSIIFATLSFNQTMSRYKYQSNHPKKTKLMKKIQPMELGSIQTSQASRDFLTHPSESKKHQRREKDRIAFPFWCKITVLPLLLMLLSIGAAIAIYAMVRYIPSSTRLTTTTSTTTTSTTTTSTTTTTTTRFLNWNQTGLTIAGVTGVSGVGANHLHLPVDLALDSSNNMYIADYRNDRIQKWLAGASSGTTVAGFGNGTFGQALNALYTPPGVFLDSQNRLFVGDSGNHRVQLFSNGSSVGRTIAGTTGVPNSTNATLYHPYGVVYDSSTDQIYVAEYANHRISSYVVGATSGTVVAGGNGPGTNTNQLFNPMHLYLDASTRSLLITNYGADTVVRWTLGASSWTLVAGTPGMNGSTSTLLKGPSSVTMDWMGNIYVADIENHRIQFFEAGTSVGRTIAGVTSTPGNATNLLNRPYTVRIDNQLNLYVTDSANHRIQKFFVY